MPRLIRRKRLKLFIFIVTCMVFTGSLQIYHLFMGFRVEICAQNEGIDVVYTWVNGSDPKFQTELNNFLKTSNINVDKSHLNQRYDDKNELKFSLRSLEKYAPWIRHVYILTNGQIPHWLDLDYEKVSIVTHEDVFLDKRDLPTFSSPAIESHLHRIAGLSRKFLYFNDDIFLGQPIYLDDFVSDNHGYTVYLSYSLGKCAPKCLWVYVADDQCDEACNNFACQYDGGDCRKRSEQETSKTATNLRINSTNIPSVINEHNTKLLANEKIKRKRYKKRAQKKLRYFFNNNSTRNDLNETLCAYSASLQHSHRLFNVKYGFIPRFVPAHTPLLIDTEIMSELQRKFFKEFMTTSRNRLRASNDLQYAFTYYHYIINEQQPEKSVSEIFDEFDTDSSGTWSDREIRTLLTRIYQLPLSYGTIEHFESILTNCTSKLAESETVKLDERNERYADSRLPSVVSKELISSCANLRRILITNFGTVKKYKYRIVKNYGSQLIHFKQLISNVTDVVGQLDDIRSEPRKFVCLNDNLDHSGAENVENEMINAIVYDFYLSLFPFPSKFELKPELRNRFLHVKELNEWKLYRFRIKLAVCVIFLLIFYLVGLNACIRNIYVIINKILS